MNTNFIDYDFDTDIVTYPSNYDSTKLNMGHLMVRNTDSDGYVYVSPIEPKFMRGYEVVKQTPFSYIQSMNSLGFLKYNSDTTWVFYASVGSQGNIAKRIFLATLSNNEFNMIGSINVNTVSNTAHMCCAINPSMEYHTGGTVSVNSTTVIGSGTTWVTDGVCSGNRIGFNSTSSSGITQWYRVSIVLNDTSLVISREYENDGEPNGLNFPIGTSYVIEDFRLIYGNFSNATNSTATPLTFLTAGRSNSPFILSTGTQIHGGSFGVAISSNPFIKGINNDFYVTIDTRIVRIVPTNIISGSTTFISDSMIELPPGTTTTFSLSSSLIDSHYLPMAQRFYIPNTTANRNYVTPYISGSTTPFERVVLANDQVQTNTYTISKIKIPTSNYIGQDIRSFYYDGLSYIIRNVVSDNNVIYVLPIEADKQYHTITNAYIVTPEFLTPSATSYNTIYINAKTYFNDDNRFIVPRENYDIYYRTTGITTDTGSWVLINQNGSMSGVTGTSIQFKIAFSTIGHTCVPSLIYGIRMSYNSDAQPLSIPFYEPSLKFTDKSSQIFSWRQNSQFNENIPNLNINIYDSSNNLLLTDSVSGSTNGIWEYSSNNGNNWNSWVSSANTIGNYIRYSASTLSASGLIIKPILYI